MTGTVLFRSADLLVRHVRGDGGAMPGTVFVTFGSYTTEHDLDRQGFGEDFLRDAGIDAIHVIPRDNAWYQYAEMPEALAAVAGTAGRLPRVFTYGSSMGGYAALRFARAVGAGTAIAISPQFSLDPHVVPFETRWQADAARIAFREGPFHPPARAIVFHDPRMALDDAHVRMFADAPGARVVPVGVPYAGHPVGPILAETGVLKRAILDIAAGRFEPAPIQRAVRAGRRRSQHHFFMLARRAERRPALRIALLRRAMDIAPESHILSELAQALDAAGETEEARGLHEAALAAVPDNVRARAAFALHLADAGEIERARRELELAAAGQQGATRLLIRTAQLRLALKRWHLGAIDRWLERTIARHRHDAGYARVARWLGRRMA